jgi:hypothetical protein
MNILFVSPPRSSRLCRSVVGSTSHSDIACVDAKRSAVGRTSVLPWRKSAGFGFLATMIEQACASVRLRRGWQIGQSLMPVTDRDPVLSSPNKGAGTAGHRAAVHNTHQILPDLSWTIRSRPVRPPAPSPSRRAEPRRVPSDGEVCRAANRRRPRPSCLYVPRGCGGCRRGRHGWLAQRHTSVAHRPSVRCV